MSQSRTRSFIQPLPIPEFFDPQRVGEVWRVLYQQRAEQAEAWAKRHHLRPAAEDTTRIGLLAIDVQNTFCIPNFELFVGDRSGMGAVADNIRLCEFIYRNLGLITEIVPTMDTHTTMQIFHAHFWVNDTGQHPAPMTNISLAEVQQGVWQVNPAIAPSLARGEVLDLQQHVQHYVKTLTEAGKYPLTIWPYHAMLGGISHALVAAVEEAIFFHTVARHTQPNFALKGSNPLTENYSVLQPEVLAAVDGQPIAQKDSRLIQKLLDFDVLIITGQAKSHCVAWTIDDLLTEIMAQDPTLARKGYLLEDCTSSVVVPGVVDFTEQANAAFDRFAAAGMHLVQSTQAIATWPNVML